MPSSPSLSLDILPGQLALGFQISFIIDETVHLLFEILVAGNLKATALLQGLSLLEPFIIGPEEHRHVPDGSLQEIMDADAEATTDISHITIMIDTRQQSKAIDDQHLSIL